METSTETPTTTIAHVAIERTEDNDASRLEASHDGYVRAFGLIHKRSVMLGNDGKELRGADQLIAKGRKKIRESAAYAVRFHLAPGVEATVTVVDNTPDQLTNQGGGATSGPCDFADFVLVPIAHGNISVHDN